jgi:hypothetical protein
MNIIIGSFSNGNWDSMGALAKLQELQWNISKPDPQKTGPPWILADFLVLFKQFFAKIVLQNRPSLWTGYNFWSQCWSSNKRNFTVLHDHGEMNEQIWGTASLSLDCGPSNFEMDTIKQHAQSKSLGVYRCIAICLAVVR